MIEQDLFFDTPDHMRRYLDGIVRQVNRPEFVADDPISIPKRYQKLQDIEITAFWTAVLAWGQRQTIISKATELFALMDDAPYEFITQHQPKDLKRFEGFKHRTFQYTDTLYFVHWLRHHYEQYESLESAFSRHLSAEDMTVEPALDGFAADFFSLPEAPDRTRKHVSCPARKSRCKRILMFLRWMVRSDDAGVDFGLWKSILPSQLLLPLDVHVEKSARRLGLLIDRTISWRHVHELTAHMRELNPEDPVRYDFALFGMGVLDL